MPLLSRIRPCLLLLLALMLVPPPAAKAYSVLTHEEVVDMMWLDQIVPLLKARFPQATDADIKTAHAYAYGGSVIQDIGYYPFGNRYFSDLLHYVQTGNFVTALIVDSTDINEYAFSLGALAHYYGDTIGHPFINEATASEYPRLRKRFGHSVTYEEDPTAHLRTEFGFDVVQVAQGHFAEQNYRDFIGFQVSEQLLHRAFEETYGLRVEDILTHEALAIGTYRRAVSSTIPRMTKVAVASYGKQIQKADPSFDKKKFIYRLHRADYRREFGRQYKEPGVGAHILAFFLKIVPKVGPFRALQLSMPNQNEQAIYMKSVNATVDAYHLQLMMLRDPTVVLHGPNLPDLDMDTGHPTVSGEYGLADRSYAKLLQQVTDPGKKIQIPPVLRKTILDFYADPAANDEVKRKPKDWQKVQASLVLLRDAEKVPQEPMHTSGEPGKPVAAVHPPVNPANPTNSAAIR